MRVVVVDPKITRELRRSVLRPLAGPDDPLPGDEVADAVHFAAIANAVHLAAFADVEPIGAAESENRAVLSTCFVYPDPWTRAPDAPAWHLRQMATDPAHRGQGAGTAVVQAVVSYVTAQGGGILWCRARDSAVEFYRRHGFRPEGDLYPGGWPAVPHQDMWRTVAAPGASPPT